MDRMPLKKSAPLQIKLRVNSLDYKWKAMLTVAIGTMMSAMDASITNISFPILTRVFGVTITTVVWVSLAYILTSTSLMLILGKTGDQFGRKQIYTIGILGFHIGTGALLPFTECDAADYFSDGSGSWVSHGDVLLVQPSSQRPSRIMNEEWEWDFYRFRSQPV